MNPVCSICTEVFKAQEDVVMTPCGHCFHRNHLETWLESSGTCPTCRRETRKISLIKVFFTDDDNRSASLNLEDILKTNDELTKNLREEREKSCQNAAELTLAKEQISDLKAKLKNLERDNSLKGANIEGLKSLNKDLTAKVINDKIIIKNLKLDLLAERQLRRIHQSKLTEAHPSDADYNIETVDEGLTAPAAASNGEETPSSTSAPQSEVQNPIQNLNCEIDLTTFRDQSQVDPRLTIADSHAYILPNKMIRGSNAKQQDVKTIFKTQFRNGKPVHLKKSLLFTPSLDKPEGFSFSKSYDAFASSSSSPQPSTSTGITSSSSAASEASQPLSLAANQPSTSTGIFGNNFPSVSDTSFKDFKSIFPSTSSNSSKPLNMFNLPSSPPSSSSSPTTFSFNVYRTTDPSSGASFIRSPFSPKSIKTNGFNGPKASER